MLPLLVFLLAFLLFAPAASADGFRPLGPMFVPRSAPAVVVFENSTEAPGTVLVAGGSTGYRGATRSAEVFVETASSWREIASLRVARFAPASALLPDGRVLVSGGSPGSGSVWKPLRSAEIYDPQTGRWTLLANQPLARRGGQYSSLPDGRMILYGGTNESGAQPTSEIFDPQTLTFAPGALPSPLVRGGQTLFRDPAMQVGGWTLGGEQAATQIYQNGTWVRRGPLQTARSSASGIKLPNDLPLLMGGWDGRRYLRSVEIFRNGRWSGRAAMPVARSNASSSLLASGQVLLIGGTNGRALSSTAIYQPSANRWRRGPELLRPRIRPNVATLWDGRVLVFGGRTTRAPLAATEVYMPSLRAPKAKILSAPASTTRKKVARFRFEADQGKFQCRLDGRRWQKCSSPQRYKKLSPGRHVFRVRSVLWKTTGRADVWRWRIIG